MVQQKFGVSVSEETAQKLEEAVDDCVDIKANRSEIVEAVLTAHFQAQEDYIAHTRDLLKQHRTDNTES